MSSPPPSNIKIEHVLNQFSAPTDPFLQPSPVAASTFHPSLTPPPPSPPLPPTPTSLLPLTATLHISEPSPATSTQFPEYRNHKKTLSLPPSTSPGQSMAAAVVVPQPIHAMQPFPRPIRFVANDGQPHAKRRRISAACKTCRKRKTRCSGEKPVCETCRQNGHSCLGYSDPAPPAPSQNPQQNNHQVSVRPTPTTAVVTTPTEKPMLKEPLFATTSTRASPQDWRNPQESSSSNSQQCELPDEPLSGGTPSRMGSQKRNSTDYHQGEDSKGTGDMGGSRAEGKGGGGPSDERSSPVLRYQTPPATQRLARRIPYFRYFGPTAIVPGYKKMVVEVKCRSSRPRHVSHSISANSSRTSPTSTFAGLGNPTPTIVSGTLGEIPFYDPNDTAPNNPLIAHLIDIFFVHLGCNFPFLRRETFTRDVGKKQVDVILVDAVCAVAARFSNHPLLQATSAQTGGSKAPQMCEYGTAFAKRAKSQVVDTFACPNLATVQACTLLAYVEFGSNRDSGLWMFLGIAIRMAQDLGLHKFEGMRGDAKGLKGVRLWDRSTGSEDRKCAGEGEKMGKDEEAEMLERERTDTFWAVFFLDRVISSGTGRPVTIREVGICLPKEETSSKYPPPFPALIKIVQLYGRVTDLLNSLNDIDSLATDSFGRLSEMETELTDIYQKLSPDLDFNTPNFQQYRSTNQGSVFLLLHMWFHTLIVLLHRPTLLIAFEGRVQQRFSNSRELSMSSAKTISDMLTCAELIDPGAVNGNPFTSQPIYIAACAFLQESLAYSSSNPTSRSSSPPPSEVSQTFNALMFDNMESASPRNTSRLSTAGLGSPISSSGATDVGCGSDVVSSDSKYKNSTDDCSQTQKGHALLAQAAQTNYQKCYKALKGLEVYWEGVRYILTVLDQKAKGSVDPLLYTMEEMESVEVCYWDPAVWDRFYGNIQGDTGDTGPVPVKLERSFQTEPAPSMFGGSSRAPKRVQSPLGSSIHSDSHPHQAIGLSATGTTNSPNPGLTWFFTNNEQNHIPQNQFTIATPQPGTLPLHDSRGGVQRSMRPPHLHNGYVQHGSRTPAASPASKYSLGGSTPASDAEMLLGLSAASQKASFGQQHRENHGHAMDGVMSGSYNSDGGFQTSSGSASFEYGIMLGSENVNMSNAGWDLHCMGYIQPPYWDSFAPADEIE